MVKTTTNEILASLRKGNRAAFRSKEIAALLGNKNYAKVALHRLKVRGEIRMVKRGWWAFADAMYAQIACEVSYPCYLSFCTALNMHGATTQIPRIIQVAVCRNASRYRVFDTQVQEYKVSKPQFVGFSRQDGLLIASKEKAFADCLNIPRASPKSVLIESITNVDLDKVKLFLTKEGKKRLKGVEKYANQK
ncbi:MAG: hypothetical protein V1644_01665 [Candidatus Micrarchaeota archaeon]